MTKTIRLKGVEEIPHTNRYVCRAKAAIINEATTSEQTFQDILFKVARDTQDVNLARGAAQSIALQGISRVRAPLIVGRLSDQRGFTLEQYIEGETLSHSFNRSTLGKNLAHLSEVADALDEMHQAGYAHQDIKPANVIIGRDTRVTIIDVDLVRRIGSLIDQNTPTSGTPIYLSPEAFTDTRVGTKRDVYAVGVCLYEALHYRGETPFGSKSTSTITKLQRIFHAKRFLVKGELEKLYTGSDELDKEAREFLGPMLSPFADQRPEMGETTELALHLLRRVQTLGIEDRLNRSQNGKLYALPETREQVPIVQKIHYAAA